MQDGPEVDVDLVFSEGQPVYGCLTDNWPTVEPYFNETGSNCPSILPMDQQKALIDLAVHSTQALGFNQVLQCSCIHSVNACVVLLVTACSQASELLSSMTCIMLNSAFVETGMLLSQS